MVEATTDQTTLADLSSEIQFAIQGAIYLSKDALIDADFKKLVESRLSSVA